MIEEIIPRYGEGVMLDEAEAPGSDRCRRGRMAASFMRKKGKVEELVGVLAEQVDALSFRLDTVALDKSEYRYQLIIKFGL